MAQETVPDRITIGEKLSLVSEVLGEERPYWVYLPASYDSSTYAPQRYPVLYLLDGDDHFHSASGVVEFMSTGTTHTIQIPEMIVVAIPNTNRWRDLTPTHTTTTPDGKTHAWLECSGGGNTFLQFVREELFPRIESAYRTLPYRILVGHSIGGLLALHALLDTHAMFQAYIAIDPSFHWDEQVLVREAESRVNDARELRASVYITMANNPDINEEIAAMEAGRIRAGRRFAQLLESASSPGVRSTLRYFEDEDHCSVPLQSLYHGLRYIFEGYSPPFAEFLNEPASSLNLRFKRISERLGVPLLPPEAVVNGIGLSLLHGSNDIEKAIALFRINVSSYPGSYLSLIHI